jgi:Protein of unknown function (DUF2934)
MVMDGPASCRLVKKQYVSELPRGRHDMSDETESKDADKVLRGEIELRAYFKYCERGCVAGCDVDDWLTAEREVLAERALAVRKEASASFTPVEAVERNPPGLNPSARRPRANERDRRRPRLRGYRQFDSRETRMW